MILEHIPSLFQIHKGVSSTLLLLLRFLVVFVCRLQLGFHIGEPDVQREVSSCWALCSDPRGTDFSMAFRLGAIFSISVASAAIRCSKS